MILEEEDEEKSEGEVVLCIINLRLRDKSSFITKRNLRCFIFGYFKMKKIDDCQDEDVTKIFFFIFHSINKKKNIIC